MGEKKTHLEVFLFDHIQWPKQKNRTLDSFNDISIGFEFEFHKKHRVDALKYAYP